MYKITFEKFDSVTWGTYARGPTTSSNEKRKSSGRSSTKIIIQIIIHLKEQDII